MNRLFPFLLVVLLIGSFAEARTYGSCVGAETKRVELDNLCPRNEGQHPATCCPPVFGAKKACEYYVVINEGQQYYSTGSAVKCLGGVNVSVPCCNIQKRDCYNNEVKIKFLPRLIYRGKMCCGESCPDPTYWRVPPASPTAPEYAQISKLTANHVLKISHNECSGGIEGTCSHNFCYQENDPCPVPLPVPLPTPVNPAPGNPNPVEPTPVEPAPAAPAPAAPPAVLPGAV